ncbi:hypothetical protein QCA50_004468 [Cerrena zonata]|uniref:Cytochrome P450 n=1 Tax=Cerrena zonata TaxID=2478898 RepID=A0AAW0GGW8_9APHY
MDNDNSNVLSLLTYTCLALGGMFILNKLRKIGSRGSGLPPGPPTLPLMGNIHQFPTEYTAVKFSQWGNEYGGLFSLKIGPGTIVVVTSPRFVKELIDRRGTTTGSRPHFRMLQIITDGLNVGMMPYGPTWKNTRKAIQMFLTKEACMRHLPIERAEAIQLLYDMIKQPENTFTHIQRHATSLILSVVFGVRSPRYENSTVTEFIEVQHEVEALLEPGAHPPIDLMPILEYIPERWASWKGICRGLRTKQQELYFRLRDKCEARIRENRRNGSFMESLFDQQEKLGLTRDIIGYIGGVSLEGGSVTAVSHLQTFVLLMAYHPEIQAKAHQELDQVVGQRLPTLEDYDHLPYIQAIAREVHRFYPAVPMGLPHESTSDETVGGYFIPKGSTIFMNIYGIYHSEEHFDEPEVFNPDRYMQSEFGTKPGADTTGFRNDLHFGGGRRICPGILLGDIMVSMNVMNLLWAFNFEATDLEKRDPRIPIKHTDFVSGLATGPNPYKCNIQPRNQGIEDTIRDEYTLSRPIFSMFEHELSDEEKTFVKNW